VPNSMESQCTLNQLDLALSQTTNAQYGFQDGTASTNLQQVILGLQKFSCSHHLIRKWLILT
jgi:hypothetical protein